MKRLALPAATALLVLSGCGGTPSTQTSVEPVPEVAQSSAQTASPATSDDQEAARAYFEAILSADPDQESDALQKAAPDSLAEAYLKHRANVDNADIDAGSSSVVEDLTEDDGNYGYCPGGDTESDDCIKWEKLRFNRGKGGLAKVTFLSAYQSVQCLETVAGTNREAIRERLPVDGEVDETRSS